MLDAGLDLRRSRWARTRRFWMEIVAALPMSPGMHREAIKRLDQTMPGCGAGSPSTAEGLVWLRDLCGVRPEGVPPSASQSNGHGVRP